MKKFSHNGYKIKKYKNTILLKVKMPSANGLFELKRRLGAKKDRKETRVEVIELWQI